MTDKKQNMTPIESLYPYLYNVGAPKGIITRIQGFIRYMSAHFVEQIEQEDRMFFGRKIYNWNFGKESIQYMSLALIAFRKDFPTTTPSSSGKPVAETLQWLQDNEEKLKQNILRSIEEAGLEITDPIRADAKKLVCTITQNLKFKNG